MAVKIRLARFGRKHKPFYRVVVADTRAPRDGKFIEIVGTYDPLQKKDNSTRVLIKMDRINHWIKQGAKPTDVVSRFIKNIDISETKNVSSA